MELPDLLRLRDELRASRGGQLDRSWTALRVSLYVFRTNANAALRFDRLLSEDGDSQPLRLTSQPDFNAAISEATRLFANFLSSASALAEHTMIHIREFYSDRPFNETYRDEIRKQLVTTPLHGIVVGLRNYSMHYALPLSGMTTQLARTLPGGELEEDRHFTIGVDELLLWDGWNPGAKRFLSESGHSVSLSSVVDPYLRAVDAFYDWLVFAEEEVNAAEFGRYDRELERVAALFRENFPALYEYLDDGRNRSGMES